MTQVWKKLLSREGVDLTTICALDEVFYSHVWEFAGSRGELFFTHLSGKHLTHYIGVDSHKLGRFIYGKYFDSQTQFEEYYANGEKLLAGTKKSAGKWSKVLEKDNSKESLLPALAQFREDFKAVCGIYSITSWLGLESWQNDFDSMLSQLIKENNLEAQREKIVASACVSWKKTLMREFQQRLEAGEGVQRILSDAQVLRSWSVVWHRAIDEAWVKSLKQAKHEQGAYSISELVKLLKPDEEQRHFLENAPYAVFFKDYRDDVRRSHAYYWTFLFEKLADFFQVDCFKLGFLSLDEIEGFLKLAEKSKARELAEKRSATSLIVSALGETLSMQVFDEGIPAKYAKIMDGVDAQEKQSQIKGLIAQKGVVTGAVKIIRSFHDVKNVREGDVLVANTTHPDYLSAMQKACAFVTNEGGVISHAAIIARELRKPCLVGTKVATKILSDGDLVEVDADKGIVRIISKK